MKVNYTILAFVVLFGAGVIVGAYQLGQRDESMPAGAAPTLSQPQKDVALFPDVATQSASQPQRFSHFRVGNRNVKSMFADGQTVWVGTSGGVIRYDTKTDNYELFDNKNSGLLSNGIFHISKLGEQIVVGTYGGGMALFDPASKQWQTINIPQGLADQFVYDVQQVANGDVWIATWSGANRVRNGDFGNPAAWETFTVENTQGGLPNPWVYGVAEGANGEVWFATEAGLARYQNEQWTNWQHEDGLGAAYEVVAADIQFKSDPAKASKHHAQQKDEQGLGDVNVAYNPNYVISMVVQKDGTVWCGTWGGGLARFDGKTWHNYTVADGLPANHIFMLYLDAQDKLWIGTSKGLANFDVEGKHFTTRTVADGLYAENVFSMTTAGDGSLWIGSFGGVAHIEKDWGY